jgi:signal transduction histidine kinase
MATSRPTTRDVRDAALATALCLAVSALLGSDPAEGGHVFDTLAVVLVVVGAAPVLVWRTRPLVPAVSALSASLVGSLLGYTLSGPMFLALGMVAVAASWASARTTRLLGLYSGATFAVVLISRNDSEQLLVGIGGFALGTVPTLIGERLRAERARALAAHELARRVEELRDRDVQRAVGDERLRIAREMHDITGHHLSAISLQAAGAGRTTDDPGARAAFERIHALTREALGQTRHALGVLRQEPEHAPQPRLARLDQLLEPVRAGGIAVDLRVDGRVRDLSDPVELCAYRVVQESLTNVIRHAGAGAVRVALGYGEDALTLEIEDDGAGGPPGDGGGIAGMRERVALAGGKLAAGPGESGGWSVRATLPLTGDPATDDAAPRVRP